jgi:hypothetical protein
VWREMCWQLVGAESTPNGPVSLVSPQPLHFSFDPSSLLARPQSWRQRRHPTWAHQALARTHVIGGTSGVCSNCGEFLRRLVLIDPVPPGQGISQGERIDFAYCYRCCSVLESTFYRHDADGRPTPIGAPSKDPIRWAAEEPDQTFLVGLTDLGPRWRTQEWGTSNARENLTRFGGEACWIQNPTHPICPLCGRPMAFEGRCRLGEDPGPAACSGDNTNR